MTDTAVNQLEQQEMVVGKKFPIRAIAYIIDVIIINLVNFIISFIIGTLFGLVYIVVQNEYPPEIQPSNIENIIFGIIIATSYFFIFEWLYGASLGKLILGMRVIMVDGSPCSCKAAIIRGLFRYIDGLLLAIPALLSMKAPLYQRIGDNSAYTIVVSSKSGMIKEHRAWWWFLIATGIFLIVCSIVALLTLLYFYL